MSRHIFRSKLRNCLNTVTVACCLRHTLHSLHLYSTETVRNLWHVHCLYKHTLELLLFSYWKYVHKVTEINYVIANMVHVAFCHLIYATYILQCQLKWVSRLTNFLFVTNFQKLSILNYCIFIGVVNVNKNVLLVLCLILQYFNNFTTVCLLTRDKI